MSDGIEFGVPGPEVMAALRSVSHYFDKDGLPRLPTPGEALRDSLEAARDYAARQKRFNSGRWQV
jgi:hypothetical protein